MMEPPITGTRFGSITVDGKTYNHDIVIRLGGKVVRRNKDLSRAECGTSHVVSRSEAEDFTEKGVERVIVGTGQYGVLKLSDEACRLLEDMGCKIETVSTPEAVELWNRSTGKAAGLFHVTC